MDHTREHRTPPPLARVVGVGRQQQHMSEYSTYDPMQSAYRLVHSTETALVKIYYNILGSLDADKCTVLVSLDLSSVFDTINHNVLLNRLHYLYGITGTAFKWFPSYIEQRNNQVCVGDSLSRRRPVTSGVLTTTACKW